MPTSQPETSGVATRRLLVGLLIGVLALVVLAGALAWRQYGDGKEDAVNDQRARAVLAVTVFDTYFAGQITTLQAMAAAPAVVAGDEKGMQEYFRRVQSGDDGPFTGGIGWIDADGISRVSSNPSSTPGQSVADRSYFQQVMATGEPFVSEGLTTRLSNQRVVVTAVPTRDAAGALTGVLAGALLLDPVETTQESIDLGYAGLDLLDREGQSLTAGFEQPSNAALVDQMRAAGAGVYEDTAGLDGADNHVVAFATSAAPDWLVVIDRSRADAFAAARRSLLLELALIAGVAAVVAISIGMILRRGRRDAAQEALRRRQRDVLADTLAGASAVREVSHALIEAVVLAVPEALVIVAWNTEDEATVRIAATSQRDREPLASSGEGILPAVQRAFEQHAEVALGTEAEVQEAFPELRRRRPPIRALHAVPLGAANASTEGVLVLLFPDEQTIDEAERDLLSSLGAQAARTVERARAFERERDVATRLQRSLLPEQLPAIEGLDLAGRYQAGAVGLQIGGDWYEVVRRQDGIVHVTVGDVAGRGIGAATLMGQLRTAFRAYAYDHEHPGEVMRHLLRHVPRDGMATAVCITIDPYTNEARYAAAGHPPPLLLDVDSGAISELAEAVSPPLGFVDAAAVREAALVLPARATLVAYTDGLVERRGAVIDDGIARLRAVIADNPALPADRLAETILRDVAAATGAEDDIALAVVRLVGLPDQVDIELPASPGQLHALRVRLRAWMALRGLAAEDADDAVLAINEACANAIEHAYGAAPGTIRLLVEHRPESLQIAVEDSGSWRVNEPDPDRGRGFELMRRVMTDVRVEKGARGTRVVLERRLAPPQERSAISV